MSIRIENWKTQTRKGYLDLCILSLIEKRESLYGIEIIELLQGFELPVKEGTLYPLLNRMATESWLSTHWDTTNVKGHPRKFYSLTKKGTKVLEGMQDEFDRLVKVYHQTKV